MTVEKILSGDGKVSERCILLGFQIDGDGRNLLGWVLTNIAEQGDCVMAVNVSRNHQGISRTPTLTLVRILNEFMTEHEALCNRKKVILAGRIARGKSIKRVLVKEAQLCDAKTVVVGANMNFSFGGSASLAKYCAKKLPASVSLIAVHEGHIIFERAAKTKAMKDCCHISYEKMRANRRNSVGANFESLRGTEERKMSVVQWAMNLPNRSLDSNKLQVNVINELVLLLKLNSSACKFFKHAELQNSTNFFSEENLIGHGGNSKVYIGCLPNGQQVAIKVSNLSENLSRDFFLEVEIITRLQQQGQIVPLIGICVEAENAILVYPYFARGSLEENLHGRRAKTEPLDWNTRFGVAVGVAKALSYLHDGSPNPVIHRDVKSSNILLSDEGKPKLSDFGLAVWGPTIYSHATHSDVVGTFGYLAPDYFMYGKVSVKIDVYSFGVVLLELLTGRKPINNESPKGQESLVMWSAPILERGDFMEILDPNLGDEYEEDQMKRMFCAASLCIRRAAHRRPQMKQVLELLQGELEIEPWMSSNLNNSLIVEEDFIDEEVYPSSSFGSPIGLSLFDVDDDASIVSYEQNHLNSLDGYLQDRWSHSSSFD